MLILSIIISFALGFAPAQQRHPVSLTALHGIKGFRGWFESQFPQAIKEIPKRGSQQDFDHVLVDLNQLLHICVRRSRSDEHALVLLMKELDAVVDLATPKASLVLAMDGPPSAAKLATQRRRRFGILHKTEFKLQQLEHFQHLTSRIKPQQLTRRRRRIWSELRTLCITPGTDFMHDVENAVLYWAWQRFLSRSSTISRNNVKIFLSPSTVPGEGEVKLLEWIYHQPRHAASIAILGGDSDLVLEGLIIPPAFSHNVFVLLPDGGQKYLVVSCWETTMYLQQHYLPELTPADMMKVRTDLVLLLILNGNDYLPKLRGSSGFNRLFRAYLRISKEHGGNLVDPDSLTLDQDFCAQFFGYLQATAPGNLDAENAQPEPEGYSALHHLTNLVESGFAPSPMNFDVVEDDGGLLGLSDDDTTTDDSDVDEIDDAEDVEDDSYVEVESHLVRLTLGDPKSDDFFCYEVWHPKSEPFKTVRQRLATIGLSDLMGLDDDEELEDFDGIPGLQTVSASYDWEVKQLQPANVEEYLFGLLWNLQTYQDGVCADYGYNYGRRHSPTAEEIVLYLQEKRDQGLSVGFESLAEGRTFRKSISAGLSCLAALPSSLAELIPEPYAQLDKDRVESFYAAAMDPGTNVFDTETFERLCNEELEALHPSSAACSGEYSVEKGQPGVGRRIVVGDHHWTAVSKARKPVMHPFSPPKPFADRLVRLTSSKWIRLHRQFACDSPRPRSSWTSGSIPVPSEKRRGFVNKAMSEILHSEPGPFLSKFSGIADVPHETAFAKGMSDPFITTKTPSRTRKLDRRSRNEKLKANGASASSLIAQTSDGHTAVAALKQLDDAGVIAMVHWASEHPSPSQFASRDPSAYELVQLSVAYRSDGADGTTVEHQYDRHCASQSKQPIKQQLASKVIGELSGLGPNWTKLTFKGLRKVLVTKLAASKDVVTDSKANDS